MLSHRAQEKIDKYRAGYAAQGVRKAFLPAVVSTSGPVRAHSWGSEKLRENGMELFAAFAGLAPARGGQAVALAWKGLRPDAGCSMRFRARRGGGLSAAAAAVGTLSCCRPVPASGCRYRAAAGDVVSAACGRGSGRVDVVV